MGVSHVASTRGSIVPSTDRLKISLAQLNPTVGDIAGNVAKLKGALATAREQGADLLVTSELFLAGYPTEDLVLKPAFLDAIEHAVEGLKQETAAGGTAANSKAGFAILAAHRRAVSPRARRAVG